MGLNSIATKPKSRFDRFTDNFSTRTHYVPPLNAKTSLDIELENDTLSADQNVSLPDNCTLINNTANNKLDEMEFTQTIPESCARAEPGFDIQKGYQITTQIQIPPPIHTSNRFYSVFLINDSSLHYQQ